MRICPGVPTQSLRSFPFVRIAHAPQGFAGSGAILPDVASGRRLCCSTAANRACAGSAPNSAKLTERAFRSARFRDRHPEVIESS
jgi:hypothetical protein